VGRGGHLGGVTGTTGLGVKFYKKDSSKINLKNKIGRGQTLLTRGGTELES